MSDEALPPEVPYPGPPWQMTGRLWMAAVRTTADGSVPPDLAAVGSRRRLMVAVVRYEAGTLTYDEFTVGSLVRRGTRIGVLARHIWVDQPASLWGGRRLWGIPKLLATFQWLDDTVSVHSGGELIAELHVRPASRRLPTLPVPAAGFGQIGDQRTYLAGRCRARVGRTRIDITGWSPHLPPLAATHNLTAIDFSPCRFTFPPGLTVGSIEAVGPTR
jgi:hypothetical protein